MKAVIMCGGVGSRLRPLTESVPKPLIKVLNRPVIDIIAEKLIAGGIDEIYLSLGYMSREIISYCEKREYSAHIVYCEEAKPLGTAGGVKNCIKKTDEDVLVLSGDNIFDFDLSLLGDYHTGHDADITVCGFLAEDPREYGVIVKDENDAILSFMEKPTWETAQSRLINTGIYLMKGKILDMIPEDTCCDFSENIFPEIFKKNLRFMCYTAEGFWGDMGEFRAYRQITHDIFKGKLKEFKPSGTSVTRDTVLPEGGEIIAPCLFGENCVISAGASVGPFCVLGSNCFVGENSVVTDSVLGDDCRVEANTDVNTAVLADSVRVYENCSIEENTVIGYGCKVDRFSRLLPSCKIWPGRRILPESVISRDMFYETPTNIDFDGFGISGRVNTQITPSDAVKIGLAVAGAEGVRKIGVGCDSAECSRIYKELCAGGVRIRGDDCFDFDRMYKAQAYFYSAYCSLDAFIFVSSDTGTVNFSFFGKNGMPVSEKLSRRINNNFRFSSFSFCSPEECREEYNMALFDTVYLSFLKKLCRARKTDIACVIESDNLLIKQLLEKAVQKKIGGHNLQLLINASGTDMYAMEKERFFSSARILALICELEFASGRDAVIPEDAPSFIEETAAKYGCRAVRMYRCNVENEDMPNEKILESLWAFDAVFMCAKLIGIMSESCMSLAQLFEYQKDFALRKNIVEFNCPHERINEIIKECGAEKDGGGIYYTCESRKGRARIRRLGNANRISVLVEAADTEAAKEISAEICEKFAQTCIDKE